MRKTFIILVLSLLVTLFGVMCRAEAAPTLETPNDSEYSDIPGANEEPTPNQDSQIDVDEILESKDGDLTSKESHPTFLDRICEYITSGEILQALSFVATAAVFFAINYLKKVVKTLFDKIAGFVKKSNAEVVESNEIIDKTLGAKLDTINQEIKSVSDLHSHIKSLEAIVVDLCDMLDTVYQGSSTVPAVTKERIATKHDHAIKMLSAQTGEDT